MHWFFTETAASSGPDPRTQVVVLTQAGMEFQKENVPLRPLNVAQSFRNQKRDNSSLTRAVWLPRGVGEKELKRYNRYTRPAGMAAVDVSAAPADRFLVTGFPTLITAGVAGGFQVTALDVYANIATGYFGTPLAAVGD